MRRRWPFILTALLALLAGLCFYRASFSPPPGEREYLCTLSVRCDTILENMEQLNKDKPELVPADGVILAETEVGFSEGESVFDVLKRTLMERAIHLEFVETPFFASAYVEGIGNLYEMDCGPLSGWMFKVNGEFATKGCSLYRLDPGDGVEWLYTCDLGRDIGGEDASLGGAGR
ncbi:MAG: DUF4430 domain-containing protein [Clostridiales bacterium]|nr:DUF4430 domain-containing protein [Clostridiales bacterium]